MSGMVIFLHGVGARGADLAPLGPLWQPRLPGVAFAAPDAPFAFDQGGPGRQWFSISGVTQENRAGRVIAARETFDDLIAGILRDHDLKPEEVALAGFSQGAIMALDALASGRWRFRAVVAFSGRLATPLPLTPADTPALVIHGDIDTAIPVQESVRAAQLLQEAGGRAVLHVLPGIGHGISPQASHLAEGFLAEHLAPVG